SSRPVRWVITSDTNAEVAIATGQDVLVPLPAGRYAVDVVDGLIARRETVVVAEKGHTALDVTIDGGTLALPAISEVLTRDALLTIDEAAQAGRGRSVVVMAMRDVPARLAMPPGKFVVGLEQGGARWQQ